MDGRCETCRFWDRRGRMSAFLPGESHACTLLDARRHLAEPLAVVRPTLGGLAVSRLWTRPDFGCVQYEREDG